MKPLKMFVLPLILPQKSHELAPMIFLVREHFDGDIRSEVEELA